MTASFGPDKLMAVVDARRGAKIRSLLDADGYEWLLPPCRPAPPGTPFVEAEMGGWDECAPTIVACCGPAGEALPDHGDLWDAVWTSDGASTTARGTSLPYRLRRTVSRRRQGISLEYEVVAEQDMPFLWAAHPQFRAPAGSRVEVGTDRAVDAFDRPGHRFVLTDADLSIDSVAAGGCRKFYLDPAVPADSAALVVPGAGRLRLRWDGDIAPYVGLWFDNRAYAREPVIAIEPSTGYYDSLARAVENDAVLRLRAGKPVRWTMEVDIR
ncbi:hypothetical protein ACXJJ3_16560 [Kribbella sp. WER1]